MVKFPVKKKDGFGDLPSLRIESEETDSMNPQNLWQVYAVGGFLVLRWLWARWQERKGRDE
ncbi:hypothetical protein QJS04_geneDACA010061 [Acorus gramineus]|uniref:Uncharacterized protein n=1 Tax=Acorus gramineus TaxID=55184 RepID=A0AAV9BHX6_ACOGR|nr:hypothetical protein QJS04_geneDACA010061 [Acorus gramineus]